MASKKFFEHWDIEDKINTYKTGYNNFSTTFDDINDLEKIQKMEKQQFKEIALTIAQVSTSPVSYLLCNRKNPYEDLKNIQDEIQISKPSVKRASLYSRILDKVAGSDLNPVLNRMILQTKILLWLLRLRQAGKFEDFSYPEPQNQQQRDFAFAAEWLYIEHQFNPDNKGIAELPKKNQIQRKLAQIRLCAQCVKWSKNHQDGFIIPSIHMILLKHSKWRNGEMTREIMDQMFSKDIWNYSAFPYANKFTDDQIAKIYNEGLTDASFWNLPILKTQFDLGALTEEQKRNIAETFKLGTLLNPKKETLSPNHKIYLLMSWCYLIWKPREVEKIDNVASKSTWRDYFNFL